MTIKVVVDGLVGIVTDRPYDWGIGTGILFNYQYITGRILDVLQ